MNIDWKTALMCVDACLASYLNGDLAKQKIRQYVYDYDDVQQFSVNTSQVTCFKTQNIEYVIAFRGTDDWDAMIKDAKTWQVDSETIGDVHAGFKEYLDDVYHHVLNWLQGLSALEQKFPIIVTGHSLGAAAASIFVTRLKHLGYENVSLYTYGSPRVGDRTWANQFSEIPAYRFVNNNDIVCRVPTGLGWYQHVGELLYINYDGQFVNYSPWKRTWDRFRSRIRALAKLEVFVGTYDHGVAWYRKRIYEQIQRIQTHS
jgi:triacylglycerol lipase